jgi:hypothetical protein
VRNASSLQGKIVLVTGANGDITGQTINVDGGWHMS